MIGDELDRLAVRAQSARYGLIVVVYVVAIWLVWRGWPQDPPDQRAYVTETALAFNHRLIVADFHRPDSGMESFGFYMRTPASVVGKYMTSTKGIAAGRPVDPTMLADRPVLTVPADSTVVIYTAVDPKLMALLDAGTSVILFGQDADAKTPMSVTATILAILCDSAADDVKSCYPALSLAAKDAPLVVKNLATLKLALTGIPQPMLPPSR
jgi:hypothetical protein